MTEHKVAPSPATRVAPEEDLVHRPGPDPRWRESYYFSFYDPERRIGGFSSFGKRAAKGHSGMIQCLWGPDRPTLVCIDTDSFEEHDDTHSVAGLTYRCEEPLTRWHIGFEGTLNDGGGDVLCVEEAVRRPGREPFAQHAVTMDLEFTASCPAYLYREAAADERWKELFDGHVDMVGRIAGRVTIDGEAIDVDAVAGNDHSWGIRNWFHPDEWRWADIVMDDEPHVTFWRARLGDTWIGDGALYFSDRAEPLTRYAEAISTTDRPDKPLATAVRMELGSEGTSRTLEGEVVRVVPVLFRRTVDGREEISWIDRSLVRLTDPSSGATGWGTVEFSDRVEPGDVQEAS